MVSELHKIIMCFSISCHGLKVGLRHITSNDVEKIKICRVSLESNCFDFGGFLPCTTNVSIKNLMQYEAVIATQSPAYIVKSTWLYVLSMTQ